MLIDLPKVTRSPAQLRWETELGRPLTSREWEQVLYRAHHTAHNSSGMEAAYKVATSWYYTPVWVHKWDKHKSYLCWRGCGATGTLIHLLWHCPKLVRYWTDVLSDINSAFQIPLPHLPEHIILGLPLSKHFPLKSLRGRQIALALLAARQVLLAKWGSTTIPDPMDWIYRLWQTLAMERLSLSADGKGTNSPNSGTVH